MITNWWDRLWVVWALKNKCLRKRNSSDRLWVLWAMKNKGHLITNWRDRLWVLWVMKNKSLKKYNVGRRAVGGVGNEKYESNKNT